MLSRHIRILVFALAALHSLVGTHAEAAESDQPFCKSLQTIRDGSSNHFIPLRVTESTPGMWSTRVTLAGFSKCNVNVTPGTGLSAVFCESSPLTADQQSETQVWNVVKKIESCVPGQFTLMGQPSGTIAFLMGQAGQGSVSVMATTTIAASKDGSLQVLPNITVSILEDASASPSADQNDTTADADPDINLPTEAQLCGPLKQVVESSNSKFQSIRGPGSEETGWDSNLKLPTLSKCKIRSSTDSDAYYDCRVSSRKSSGAAESDYFNILKLVSACVGPTWVSSSSGRPDGRKYTYLKEPNGKGEIEVRLGARDYAGEYDTHLDVDTPSSH